MVYKWSREQIEELIYCVEQNPCIYNIKSLAYLDRKKKARAFDSILKEMQKMDRTITLEEIKRRWKNLRTQYRQEIRAVKQSEKYDSGKASLYVPKLWCFRQLHFLAGQSYIKVTKDEGITKKRCDRFKQKCRICLEDNAEVNWNDFLSNHRHLTYKDCYYKYTQLDYFEGDNFPTMLCPICSNELESIENFISKAVVTHNSLLQKLPLDVTYNEESEMEKEEAKFEMIFVQESDTKSDAKCNPLHDEEFREEIEEIEISSISTMSEADLTQTKSLKKVSKQYIPMNDEEFPEETEEDEGSSISQMSDSRLTQTKTLRNPIPMNDEEFPEETEEDEASSISQMSENHLTQTKTQSNPIPMNDEEFLDETEEDEASGISQMSDTRLTQTKIPRNTSIIKNEEEIDEPLEEILDDELLIEKKRIEQPMCCSICCNGKILRKY